MKGCALLCVWYARNVAIDAQHRGAYARVWAKPRLRSKRNCSAGAVWRSRPDANDGANGDVPRGSGPTLDAAARADCAVGSGWWAEPPYPPWALHRRGPGRPILGGFGGGPGGAPGPPKNRPGRVPRIYALKGGLRGHRTLTAIGLTMHMSDNDMVMMMPLASSLTLSSIRHNSIGPNRSYNQLQPNGQLPT